VSLKVVYVLGWGRSGTTLLANLLGELDGFFAAGELTYLWERGLLGNGHCGCGKPVRSCPIWSDVLRAAYGIGLKGVDPTAMVSVQRASLRVRHTWRLLRLQPGAVDSPSGLATYVDALKRLYRTLSDIVGARVIVDSSKRPSDGAVLRLLPGIDPYFIHMVRDPRAVAYSWMRAKQLRPNEPKLLMRTHRPLISSLNWVLWNVASESVRTHQPQDRSMYLRYEDFLSDPRATLTAIARMLDESTISLPFAEDGRAMLSGNHNVSGNPSRFNEGLVQLRTDDEWTTRQPWTDRFVATSVALPVLARFGYPIARPKRPPTQQELPHR
jgi:Sulfotransferase family